MRTGCEVQVAYAIGVSEPVSVDMETFGTAHVDETRLSALVREHFDLRPGGIIEMLDLARPIYRATAAYGHFGRDEPRLHLGADRSGGGPRRGGGPAALLNRARSGGRRPAHLR